MEHFAAMSDNVLKTILVIILWLAKKQNCSIPAKGQFIVVVWVSLSRMELTQLSEEVGDRRKKRRRRKRRCWKGHSGSGDGGSNGDTVRGETTVTRANHWRSREEETAQRLNRERE